MESGLILFNKPSGITSFDALRDIKRALGTGKVGHTGTLDKFASGLLLILVGKALKLSRWFTHCDKKYEGRIKFGVETDTLDPQGSIVAQEPVPSQEEVEKILNQFTGVIMQAPPAFSAIHINGKRASDLARSGEAPEMKKREVTIYKIELRSWQPPFADIFVHCSSGTYIRSLARDIALAAGSRGHLDALLRTDIAGFSLEMAFNQQGSGESGVGSPKSGIYSLQPALHNPLPTAYSLLPINKNIISTLGLSWFEVTKQEAEDIFHGKPLDAIIKNKPFFPSRSWRTSCLGENSSLNPILAVFESENLIAVIEKVDGKWKYGCVM